MCLSGTQGTITGGYRDVFIDQFNLPVRDQYMKKHFGTGSSVGANWKHVARVLKTDKKNRSKNTKLLHNQYNTFEICNRWKTSSTELYPLCNTKVESWEHIPKCEHAEIRRVCNIEINRIRKEMRKVRTEPSLEHHLLTCIRAYTEDRQPVVPDNSFPDLRNAHNEQSELGWSNFIKGIWAAKWEKIEHSYYSHVHDKEDNLNIDVWSKKMVQTMLVFFRTVWKERCDIVQAQKTGTLDSRLREKTFQYCKQIRCEIWKLHIRDRHLIRKPAHFFRDSSMQQILAWEKRVSNALMRERMERRKMKLPINHQQPTHCVYKQVTVHNTSKRYKQTTIPFQQHNRISTSASNDEETVSRTSRSMTARKKREHYRIARQNRQLERVRRTSRKVQRAITTWCTNVGGRILNLRQRHGIVVEKDMDDIIPTDKVITSERVCTGSLRTDEECDSISLTLQNETLEYYDSDDEIIEFEDQCKYLHDIVENDGLPQNLGIKYWARVS